MFFLDLKALKTSLILVTVEIACILTAETVELIFYKRSIFFVNSIGLSCRLIYCSNTRSVHENWDVQLIEGISFSDVTYREKEE